MEQLFSVRFASLTGPGTRPGRRTDLAWDVYARAVGQSPWAWQQNTSVTPAEQRESRGLLASRSEESFAASRQAFCSFLELEAQSRYSLPLRE
jgi:hypothetical protein